MVEDSCDCNKCCTLFSYAKMNNMRHTLEMQRVSHIVHVAPILLKINEWVCCARTSYEDFNWFHLNPSILESAYHLWYIVLACPLHLCIWINEWDHPCTIPSTCCRSWVATFKMVENDGAPTLWSPSPPTLSIKKFIYSWYTCRI